MRLALTLLINLVVSFQLYASEQFNLEDTPSWVTQVNVPEVSSIANHVDGLIYLLVDKQLNYLQDDVPKYYHYATKAISLQGVEELSQISIDFDPSYHQVNFHHLNVIRDGKIIDKSKDVEFKRLKREVDLDKLLYSGEETYHLILKDIKIGDVLDYSFIRRGVNPVFKDRIDNHISVGWQVPVTNTYVEIQYPQGSDLEVTIDGKSEVALLRSTEKGISKAIYADQMRAYRYYEPDQPSWYEPYPNLRVNNLASWDNVVKWAYPLYQPDFSGESFSQAMERVKSVQGNEEQIIKAIQIAQEEIRYLGVENNIGSHAPRQPNLVLEQGYGDCKDKALLLVSLLRNLGIKAYPALVDTYYRHTLDTKKPGYSVFNHVIVYFEYLDQPYWIDATNELQATKLDMITTPTLGYGLVIKKGNNQLTEINSSQPNEIYSTASIKINNDQPSSMVVNTKYIGKQADRMRRYIVSNSLQTISDDYEDYYTKMYPDIYLEEEITISDDREANTVTFWESYVLDEVWEELESSKKEAIVYGDLVSSYLNFPEKKRRKTPYNLGREVKVTQNLEVLLDTPFQIEDEQISVETNEFDFSFELATDKSAIGKLLSSTAKKFTIKYVYDQKKQYVNSDNYRKYLKNMDKLENTLSYVLTISE